jgi:hypothetical protein
MGVHREFADIVEEGRPAEPVPIGLREPHFFGDHVRKCPDSFGVPTGLSIVTAERRRERQYLLGHGGRHVALGTCLVAYRRGARAAFELASRSSSPSYLQPLGGLVGEEHAHLQQGSQW